MSSELFSGENSMKYLAERLKYKRPIVSQFFRHEEIYKYPTDKIPIGIDEFGEVVFLNTKKSFKMLVAGGTGSGKTWLLREIWNRFYAHGGAVAIPTDIKPEYNTSVEPVQKKFWKFLLKNEQPRSFPVHTYYPFFFTNFVFKNFEGQDLCQLSMDTLNIYDFITLLDLKDFSNMKRAGIEECFKQVQDGEIYTLEELRKQINNSTTITTNTKRSLIALIKTVEELGVVGDTYSGFSFTQDILKNKIPNLNLYGFNKMGRYTNYASNYVAVVIRELLSSKAEGILPTNQKLLIPIDEASRFCPATGMSTSKREILECLDLSRQYRISMIFSAQDIRRIPQTLFEQSDYVCIPKMDLDIAKEIIRRAAPQEYDYPVNFQVDLAHRLGQMKVRKDGSRDWLLIDKRKGEMIMFQPLAPLSFHKEESDD